MASADHQQQKMATSHKTVAVGSQSIRGVVSPDGVVASFLGIPFAKIPARWRQAALIDAFDTANAGVVDATKYGPMVPQPQGPMPSSHALQSEFACLNLNVWAPAGALETGRTLPVIAWVHGGGYMWGSNAGQGSSFSVLFPVSSRPAPSRFYTSDG